MSKDDISEKKKKLKWPDNFMEKLRPLKPLEHKKEEEEEEELTEHRDKVHQQNDFLIPNMIGLATHKYDRPSPCKV